MKKKTAAKKISGSETKKEVKKKIKKVIRIPEKKAVTIIDTKSSLSKKKDIKPSKAVERYKIKAKTKPEMKTKNITDTKTETKAKVRAEKTKSKKKEIRVIKKISQKSAGKAEEILRKAALKRKTKILSETVKKSAPEKKTVVVIKTLKTPDSAEKIRKPEKKVGTKISAKPVVTGKITKPSGKTRLGAKKKVAAKKIRTSEAIKKAPGLEVGEIKRQSKTGGIEQIKAGPAVVAKIRRRPAQAGQYPPMPPERLPSQYDENGITIIVVNPCKIFTFWEVREDTLKMLRGDLAIRLYDVSGADLERMDANNFLDILVNDRIGSLYIDVIPDRDYISDIGLIYSGIFTAIARSNKVRTPHATAEDAIWPTASDDAGIRPGY